MRTYIMFLLYFTTLSTTVALALSLSSMTDKRALLSLKVKLTNGEPESLPSWNESLHFCEWEGVTCGRRHMRVTILHLENQNWGGTLEPALGNLTFLRKLKFSNINLHGEIPREVGRLKRLQVLDLSKNKFQGKIPIELSNCTNLKEIILLYNQLTGNVPSWFDSMTQLNKLLLGANNLVGNFSTHLNWLSMAGNQIYGGMPERIGQLIGLTRFDMMENFLEGTIPDSIGRLTNLVRLVLQENKLSGKIPIVIGNLTNLSEFYLHTNKLEGSIPSTLRYCTKLQSFGASDNNLSGDIPDQTFGYIEDLINLDLSNNSLIGPLPYEFGNLKHLSILYLHENKLSGEIPSELGACMALRELVLGGNFFQGSIPLFLASSLRSLEILDLSSNNFTSVIPRELENLPSLNSLNLSFNNLYGEVPVRGVFGNVSAISLIGNSDLCGGIPQLKLPTCSRLLPKKHTRLPKKKFVPIIVIGGIFISVIAFIGIYFLGKKTKKSFSLASLQNGHMEVTYQDLHEATNGFSLSNLVGAGSFGSVYKGSLLKFKGTIVVKVLKLETRGALKSFVAECKVLEKMKHKNLLKLLTFCSSVDYNGEVFKAIVFEFMPMGNLENLLHNNEHLESRNLNINLRQRLSIALDVAQALDYLHHNSHQVVVHCDIKPSNVLLDDDIVAYLGDFGLARFLHGATASSSKDQVSSSAIQGTIGYVPPEYGVGGKVSPQGDIYSYGILLLEMLTAKRPTDNMFGEGLSLHKLCKTAIPQKITEIADSQLLIPFSEEQIGIMEDQREILLSFARIGVACSAEYPAQRMSIKDVITELHAIKQKLSL
ncbi:hypothetical protein TSUD_212940 [Trifolium subterraneum]|uniref:non-specific serine/threonine protein kinase n=1 Tax=Trifolium subterraneum TaxID=3900 RepID=A0A2Z6MYT3_TRISU|nr:hypothetical protein TSUD_212940 [Trifolium subterraneum]